MGHTREEQQDLLVAGRKKVGRVRLVEHSKFWGCRVWSWRPVGSVSRTAGHFYEDGVCRKWMFCSEDPPV